MVKVRRIQAGEGAAVRDLRIAALQDTPEAFGADLEDERSLPIEVHAELAADRACSEKDAFFVAIDKGQYVGMIGAFFDNETSEPFICSMWVRPERRRSGLGNQLLLSALGWLGSLGATCANAWVTQTNGRAISFYEAAGFSATETVQALPSNPELSEVLYVRQLPVT